MVFTIFLKKENNGTLYRSGGVLGYIFSVDCELRVNNCELDAKSCELGAINCELDANNCELGAISSPLFKREEIFRQKEGKSNKNVEF